MKRKSKLLKKIVIALFITFLIIAGSVAFLTRTETVRFVIQTAISKNNWQVDFTEFKWSFARSRITIKDLVINNPEKQKKILVDDILIKYKPWHLLRGKIYLSKIKIGTIDGNLLKTLKKEKKKFNITKLIFLRNIIIDKGEVGFVKLTLPKEKIVESDNITLSINSDFWGESHLNVTLNNFYFKKQNNEKINIKEVSLDVDTALSELQESFPFFDNTKGKLKIKGLTAKYISIDSFDSNIDIDSSHLSLSPVEVNLFNNKLKADFFANLDNEEIEFEINIPEPIELPYLGKPMSTFETDGKLSGFIKGKTTGFDFKQSKGRAQVNLKYAFNVSPDPCLELDINPSWQKGAVDIEKGVVKFGENKAYANGIIDVLKKSMNVKAEVSDFPAELVFDKFQNPHFKKIFGKTTAEGILTGWGKDFKVIAKGVTKQGGYTPLAVDTIKTEVDASYNNISLDWVIIEEDISTGKAHLGIKLGPKKKDIDRKKDLDLQVKINNHPLVKLLPGFRIDGDATGELSLTGPHTSFTGKANIIVTNGQVLVIPIEQLKADLNITRKKLTFDNIEIIPQTLEKVKFEKPVFLDILAEKIKIYSDPLPGLDLEIDYNYNNKIWYINKLIYDYIGENRKDYLNVKGSIADKGNLELKANGAFDLALMNTLGVFIREASGPVDLNVKIGGTSKNPSVNGTVEFKKCFLSPRQFHLPMEEVSGLLKFSDYKIFFDRITGFVDDGKFDLDGYIKHQEYIITETNFNFRGEDLGLRTDDNSFRAEFSGDLEIKGKMPNPLLSGTVTILDGKYTKDFNLIDQVTKKDKKQKIKEKDQFNPKLNLKVNNTGDLYIRNNVGDISLRTDFDLTGTSENPKIDGAIEVVEGELHYMGMDFDITRGFIEFRGKSSSPYLEVVAQREFKVYNIIAELYGFTDNLALELSGTSSNGPLDKKDIISLLAFGMTESEREQIQAQQEGQFGVSMAAQQFTHVVERPVTELAHLDTFRLEAGDPSKQVVSRISVGKQLSDRLSLDFTTDINTKNAIQTLVAEYLFTDNLLLKAARSTDGKYELNSILRFRMR